MVKFRNEIEYPNDNINEIENKYFISSLGKWFFHLCVDVYWLPIGLICFCTISFQGYRGAILTKPSNRNSIKWSAFQVRFFPWTLSINVNKINLPKIFYT